MRHQMKSFDPILQEKDVGWSLGPSVLVLRVHKVGASDRPPADFDGFAPFQVRSWPSGGQVGRNYEAGMKTVTWGPNEVSNAKF